MERGGEGGGASSARVDGSSLVGSDAVGVGATQVLLQQKQSNDSSRGRGGVGRGAGADHSVHFNAGDNGVHVVFVQLRLQFGARTLRVQQSVANAHVGCSVQPGDGHIHRSKKA